MKYRKEMEQAYLEKLIQQVTTDPHKLIQQEEKVYQQKILEVCDEILARGSNIILLTGPSASGKTTSAMQIIQELERRGKRGGRISLDDFYRNNEDQPNWSDGRPNYESIDSIDVPYFNEKITELLEHGQADFPLFDFKLGKRSPKTFSVSYDPETYLIFEGINALDPVLCKQLDPTQITRIYVSVHTDFVDENGDTLIKARNLRLMRRLLRDSVHRDADAEETLQLWRYVRMGEKLYIKPYRKLADIHINSAHLYEPFLYHRRIIRLLEPMLQHPEYGGLAQEVLKAEYKIPQLLPEWIPESSLIQEFISLK